MGLKEISLSELLDNTSGTEYFSLFAKLIGRVDDAVFFEGITDDDLYLVEELEETIGDAMPSHYLEFLNYLNGGSFLNIDLFSLTDSDYPNSLMNRNFYSDVRSELGLATNVLIVGKCEHYIIFVECGESDSSYTLMDVRNNEKIEFQTLASLIGFMYYMFVINENKKILDEKREIQNMKEKLHNEFKKKNAIIKKETEKKNAKIRAKVAGKALKEQLKKMKKRK